MAAVVAPPPPPSSPNFLLAEDRASCFYYGKLIPLNTPTDKAILEFLDAHGAAEVLSKEDYIRDIVKLRDALRDVSAPRLSLYKTFGAEYTRYYFLSEDKRTFTAFGKHIDLTQDGPAWALQMLRDSGALESSTALCMVLHEFDCLLNAVANVLYRIQIEKKKTEVAVAAESASKSCPFNTAARIVHVGLNTTRFSIPNAATYHEETKDLGYTGDYVMITEGAHMWHHANPLAGALLEAHGCDGNIFLVPADFSSTLQLHMSTFVNAHALSPSVRRFCGQPEEAGTEKKRLEVILDTPAESPDWPQFLQQFKCAILRDAAPLGILVPPDFSTNTPVHSAVAAAALMDGVQEYYSYFASCLSCGLNNMALGGTAADWTALMAWMEALYEKLSFFSKSDPKVFSDITRHVGRFKDVASHFVLAAVATEDSLPPSEREWFNKMVLVSGGGSGRPKEITGWLCDLLYDEEKAGFLARTGRGIESLRQCPLRKISVPVVLRNLNVSPVTEADCIVRGGLVGIGFSEDYVWTRVAQVITVSRKELVGKKKEEVETEDTLRKSKKAKTKST